jgi:hypothetical protein
MWTSISVSCHFPIKVANVGEKYRLVELFAFRIIDCQNQVRTLRWNLRYSYIQNMLEDTT